jgi:hypothetical protein
VLSIFQKVNDVEKDDIPLSMQHDLLIEYNVGSYPRSPEDHIALTALSKYGYFIFYEDGQFETTDLGRRALAQLSPLFKPLFNSSN